MPQSTNPSSEEFHKKRNHLYQLKRRFSTLSIIGCIATIVFAFIDMSGVELLDFSFSHSYSAVENSSYKEERSTDIHRNNVSSQVSSSNSTISSRPENHSESMSESSTVSRPVEKPKTTTVLLWGSGTNIRSGPGTEYDILGTTSDKGTPVEMISKQGSWYKILYNGREAYVKDTLVTTPCNYYVTMNADRVPYFDHPNNNPEKNLLGYITNYEILFCIGETTDGDGWCLVEYNGSSVYIQAAYTYSRN